MSRLERSPRERLYWLLDLLLAGAIDLLRFSEEFERTYVLDLSDSDLDDQERLAFERVFKAAAWFAPDHERAEPGGQSMTSGDEVLAAVVEAKEVLRRGRN